MWNCLLYTSKEIISSSEYTKLDKKLQDQYADLLKNQVSNNVEIYYHDKLLRHHSIGQRASALILFILMQSDNDIILIDQPEDDLDNKIIYDEVITAIAKKKQDIQFIFATHNANIPVLGDAERIFVVEYQDTTIDISQGNIDLKSTHKQIVDIMEGGEEALSLIHISKSIWKEYTESYYQMDTYYRLFHLSFQKSLETSNILLDDLFKHCLLYTSRCV